jgi:rRNA maturation endonuclease Nob1
MYKFWLNIKFWYAAGYATALTAAYFYQCWRLHSKHINQCYVCKLYFHRNNVDICRKCSWRPLIDHKVFSTMLPVKFPVIY